MGGWVVVVVVVGWGETDRPAPAQARPRTSSRGSIATRSSSNRPASAPRAMMTLDARRAGRRRPRWWTARLQRARLQFGR